MNSCPPLSNGQITSLYMTAFNQNFHATNQTVHVGIKNQPSSYDTMKTTHSFSNSSKTVFV